MKRNIIFLFYLVPLLLRAQVSSTQAQKMKWWQDAKFGLFLHLGLYAATAGNWKYYPSIMRKCPCMYSGLKVDNLTHASVMHA